MSFHQEENLKDSSAGNIAKLFHKNKEWIAIFFAINAILYASNLHNHVWSGVSAAIGYFLELLGAIIYPLWENLLGQPLRKLYRFGPSFTIFQGEFGFWEGAAIEDICSRVTNHHAEFWRANMGECLSIYTHKEDSFLMAVESAAYVIVLLALLFNILKGIGECLADIPFIGILFKSK